MNLATKFFFHNLLIFFTLTQVAFAQNNNNNTQQKSKYITAKKINKILLTRKNKNKYITDDAILSKIPYQEDTIFDVTKTSKLIHNLYEINKPYGFFEQIYVMQENIDSETMNLHVITYEKPELEEIIILGNKQIADDTIDEKLALGDIQAINEVDIQRIKKALEKIYHEKNFQLVDITYDIYKKGNKASVVFVINEGIKSFVKRVRFKGNNNIPSKELRGIIFTREDWPLGFANQAGTYSKEMIEVDKYILEKYYNSKGYIMAKVTDVEEKMNEATKQYDVCFTISEGDCYTVSDVSAPGNDIVPENILLMNISLKPGCTYSSKELSESIERLKKVWGIYGYIFADIEPIVIPDQEKKTVSITLNSELGDKVYVNRINIKGNKKTQDKVVRRRLTFSEGDLLTSSDMDASKMKVENLGYFDPRDGVHWKINRIDENTADLDLVLKEVKTGRINFQAGFGGSDFNIYSAAQSLKLGGGLSDINFLGTGLMVRVSGSWSKEESAAAFNIANPWFLEKPILAEMDLHITKANYADELVSVRDFTERLVGGFFGLGFTISKTWLKDSAFSTRIGGENIVNEPRPLVNLDSNIPGSTTLQRIIDLSFQNGNFLYLTAGIAKDYRNHAIHPSSGYQWSINTKFGASGKNLQNNPPLPGPELNGFGFAKIDLDGAWYTPLIGENTLIFSIHGHVGLLGTLKDKSVPYRELYHVGGPASVRGFLYGQISPMFLGNSIGAKKAFWVNLEAVFPITEDFNMKGSVFYDGGAGWDAAYTKDVPENQLRLLTNNCFNFRHAIGFGFRMLSPQPISIYAGFKLDKEKGEKAVEVHFSANRDF